MFDPYKIKQDNDITIDLCVRTISARPFLSWQNVGIFCKLEFLFSYQFWFHLNIFNDR